MNKETIEISKELFSEIRENFNKDFITISEFIDSVGDHEEVYYKFIICRITDRRYFKFEFCKAEHVYDDAVLNEYPLKATQVLPKEVTTIVYE